MNNRYRILLDPKSRLPCWEVFDEIEGYQEWIATFATKEDAETFVKIKQVQEILTA